MKKLTLLLMALLLLAACAGPPAATTTEPEKTTTVPTETTAATEEIQTPAAKTDRLVVYTVDANYTFNWLLSRYQKANPQVKVEVTNFGTDLAAYRKAVSGENPPDIFSEISFENGIDGPMRKGRLADLTLYFAADETYAPDEYNRLLLEAGQYEGAQMVVPLTYHIPFYITTEEAAQGTGLWPLLSDSILPTQTDFVQALLAYKTAAGRLPAPGTGIAAEPIIRGSGVPLWDWEEGAVNVRGDGFQQMLQNVVLVACELTDKATAPTYTPHENLAAGECLLFRDVLSVNGVQGLLAYDIWLTEQGQTPRALALPPASGEGSAAYVWSFLAVNAQSNNIAQAYDLIRFVMDEPVNTHAGQFHASNEITALQYQVIEQGIPMEVNEISFVKIPAGRGLSAQMKQSAIRALDSVQQYTLPSGGHAFVLSEVTAYANGERYDSLAALSDAIEKQLLALLAE